MFCIDVSGKQFFFFFFVQVLHSRDKNKKIKEVIIVNVSSVIKGIVDLKINFLSSFTHPHILPNLNDFQGQIF